MSKLYPVTLMIKLSATLCTVRHFTIELVVLIELGSFKYYVLSKKALHLSRTVSYTFRLSAVTFVDVKTPFSRDSRGVYSLVALDSAFADLTRYEIARICVSSWASHPGRRS